MANANRPSGLVPVGYLNGSDWSGKARLYSIGASNASVLAIGDPVASGGTADANGVPDIVLATAGYGNALRGAIVGLGVYEGGIFDPTNLDRIYKPASDSRVWYAMVADDPSTIFEVQDIGTGTPLAITDVGINVDLVSGTYNGYVSGWMLNNASKATTATYQMRILGAARRRDNVVGQYCKWLCMINNHELRQGAAGV